MRPVVDHISIIFQQVSNCGLTMTKDDNESCVKILNSLIDEGVVDNVQVYTPNLNISVWKNEMIKRQVGYDHARSEGCTHFISMDVDEFYNPNELIVAKDKFEQTQYDGSVCKIVNYYGDVNHRFETHSDTMVPFIYKIKPDGLFQLNALYNHGYKCDPTRQVISNSIASFDDSIIVMHHMSMVRRNGDAIRLKLDNSSSKIGFPQHAIDTSATYYDEWVNGDKKQGLILRYDNPTDPIYYEDLTYNDNNWIWCK